MPSSSASSRTAASAGSSPGPTTPPAQQSQVSAKTSLSARAPVQHHALAVAAAHQHAGGGVPEAPAVDLAARCHAGHPPRGVVHGHLLVSGRHRGHPARLGSGYDRAPHHGHRGRVRHLRAGRPHRQPGDHLHAGGARLRGGRRHPALAPGAVGLRGGVAAARRPRVRPVRPHAAQPRRLRARRPRCGQRHPHQRRPALRRPRPPGVLHARGHHPARRRDLGQGGGAGDGGGRDARGHRARARRGSSSTRTTSTARARATARTRTT